MGQVSLVIAASGHSLVWIEGVLTFMSAALHPAAAPRCHVRRCVGVPCLTVHGRTWRGGGVAEVMIDGRAWRLGESLGSGGFGRVYLATSEGEEAVVKLVPKDPGAQRELLLAGDLSGVPNVMPVIGVGETDDSWAIVMPRGDQSLRSFLEALGRPLDQFEAVPILLDVAQALVGLSTKLVVHRDLKPDNILLLDGCWCLTDFGISRYVEATTAIDTRKYSMTKPYAAPEQWREQRATAATDVYAFGVIAFEMLTGQWPFDGPDFRDQHLHQPPPSLSTEVDSPLRSIIDECLTKAPQARPTAARLVSRLQAQSAAESPNGGVAALVEAHHQQVRRVSEQARRDSAASPKRTGARISSPPPPTPMNGSARSSAVSCRGRRRRLEMLGRCISATRSCR